MKETRLPALPPDAFVQLTLSDLRSQIIDETKAKPALLPVSFGGGGQPRHLCSDEGCYTLTLKRRHVRVLGRGGGGRGEIDHIDK